MGHIRKGLDALNSKRKKELIKKVEEQFGCTLNKDWVYMINNKGKIYVVNKELIHINLSDFWIDSVGLYLGRFDGELRPSIEGSQIIGKSATKNIYEVDKEGKHEWMMGIEPEIGGEDRVVIVKHKNDFLGAGKVRKGKLLTGVPKARRLRVVNEE